MICDIFITTHSAQFEQLNACLHSIARFCSGFRSVLVVIPYASRSALGALTLPGIEVDLRCCDDFSEPRVGRDVTILSADTYSDAQLICHVAPDLIFQRSTTLADLLSGELPRAYLEPLDEAHRHRLEATEKWLGFSVDYDFSRHPPFIYPRKLYQGLRRHCNGFHGMDLPASIARFSPPSLSPLDALGAFAYRFYQDALRWIDLSTGGIDPCSRLSQCNDRPTTSTTEAQRPHARWATRAGKTGTAPSAGQAPTQSMRRRATSPPAVALAVHGYHPQIGGCETRVRWLAEALSARGSLNPMVVAPRNPEDPPVVNGVEICPDPLAALSCDVVLTYTVSDLTLKLASYLRRAGGRRPAWLHHPCAVEDWGLDLLLDADRVVAFNDRDTELTRLVNGSAQKVARIWPGVHPERRGTPGRFRSRIGADYILWVGAWTVSKGVRSLSRRFAALRRRHPDVSLKLVMFGGYGGDEWPVSHPDIITFDRNWTDVPDALADCLFLAFNSAPRPIGFDANPIILMEAFLNGKTFVAQSGTPFLPEVGDLGWIVEDDKSWLEAAEALLFDPAHRASLERACLEASRSRYSLENMVSGFEATVLELLGVTGVSEE